MEADDALLDVQIRTLYRLDGTGRLLATNEAGPEFEPAPRFFLGRTRARNVPHYRHDLPGGIVADLDGIVAREPAGDLSGAPPATLDAVRRVLAEHAPIRGEWRGPAYRFPEAIEAPDPGPDARIVAVDEENAALLDGTLPAWALAPDVRPCLAVVVAGRAAAICHASRRSAEAAEAGVETLPDQRRRGYGLAVVAAWARAVREAGLIPLYSTSWDNLASRALARRLGLILFAEDLHID